MNATTRRAWKRLAMRRAHAGAFSRRAASERPTAAAVRPRTSSDTRSSEPVGRNGKRSQFEEHREHEPEPGDHAPGDPVRSHRALRPGTPRAAPRRAAGARAPRRRAPRAARRVDLDHRREAEVAAAPANQSTERRSTAAPIRNAKTRQSTASSTSGRNWIDIAHQPRRGDPEQPAAKPQLQCPKQPRGEDEREHRAEEVEGDREPAEEPSARRRGRAARGRRSAPVAVQARLCSVRSASTARTRPQRPPSTGSPGWSSVRAPAGRAACSGPRRCTRRRRRRTSTTASAPAAPRRRRRERRPRCRARGPPARAQTRAARPAQTRAARERGDPELPEREERHPQEQHSRGASG